jgi:protein TonB
MSSQPPNRSAAVPPPPPPAPLPVPPATRVRNFLGWAFLISIGIHLVAGPFLGRYKPYAEQDKEVEKVSVTKKIKVVVPTPPPPTPPPTPPPKTTPPPKQQTAPPETKKLKLNVVHTHSKSAGSQNAYVAPQVGNEEGNPNGNSNNGPAAAAAAGTPAGPPQPTATPKPACANPHVDATVTRAVEPDYPELARQQGAVGVTQVEVTLTETGAVSDTKVYKSSGNASLDKAALAAAKQSAYSPEIDNCQKEAGTYLFRAEFTAQ